MKADEVFKRQAGKLLNPTYFEGKRTHENEEEFFAKADSSLQSMVAHEISLNCSDFKEANFDIVIEGLGWISIQGRGFLTMNLLLPEGI